ncbi:aminotransferase class V-fold PLP-dependent enzyme [Apilactobacillus xinyiensis]|uniref:aminotransferase class V-fold PLP-dependent enzyme n=1 Tax=Apilactobacillus xinyiensis TaxID=2841032 RepID=UPI001C7DCF15|nr:cysteine desulfurase [Apilactobacillus xinyiensis]
MLDDKIRNDFPFFKNNQLIYLDNAATTQKPQIVIDRMADDYTNHSFNVHRSNYMAAQRTTDAYEKVRTTVSDFIGSPSAKSIVFTKSTTDGINIVANGYFAHQLQPGDEIVVAISEHHSNLLPWQRLTEKCDAHLRYIELNEHGQLDVQQAQKVINDHTKLVAVAAVSNVLGNLNPIEQLAKIAHQHNAEILIDAAQWVPDMPVNISAFNPDWLVFSGHKMLAPTGIGVLYGKPDLLEKIEPTAVGGDMVTSVDRNHFKAQPIPIRLEAGTPNVMGVLGLGAALDYLNTLDMHMVQKRCQFLGQFMYDKLSALDGVVVYGNPIRDTGIVTFNVEGVHAHDVASALDLRGIAVRAGYHCAEPLMQALHTNATVRASAYFYNTQDEISQLVKAVKATKEFFTSYGH